MGYGKRPVRGGKRKLDRRNSKSIPKPKAKKGKFNLRESSYVKERDAKNAEIENRRKKIEEEEKLKQREETSDEEEEDPMKTLMSTFSHKNLNKTKVVSESESESESEAEVEAEAESRDQLNNETDVEIDSSDESANETDEIKSDKKLDREEEDPEAEDDEDFKLTIQENEEDDETAREDSGIINDPFSLHLINDLSDDLYAAVSSLKPSIETHQSTWPALGKLIIQIPKCNPAPAPGTKACDFIKEDKRYTDPGTVPLAIRDIDWNKLFIKNQIQNNITKANYKNINDNLDENPSALTPTQKELFSIVNNYQDLLFCERTFDNESEIMFTYCLHTINHLLKTRTKILHHNAKLSKANNSLAQIPDEYRDQGLVRPKVLIIVPFRHSCLKIVELLIEILIGDDKGGSVVNKKRFIDEFAGGDTLRMPKKNPKPEDYEKIFSGNIDDTFKIGIALTKKTLKLYCDFYSSDIIITSVLGLRMLVGADGEENRDYDFLSSIELLIMDQCDLFYMQNWDHLVHILNHLHLQPKELDHGTDFSRVRSWAVNGWAKYYRQTLIFSGVHLPEIHSVFNKFCHNYAGKIKVMNPVSNGSICQVVVQLQQVFYKVDAANYQQAIDARFDFFVNKILPQYKDSIMNHTLIFVPSYFDYVKLRNYFKKEDLNFVQICEYSKDAKIARARDMFFHSDAHYLVYSERFHFFRRITVKGIRHLIFYAPPTFSNFYSEMCNFMHEANQNPRAGSDNNMTVTTLYSKYDNMQLAAILGTERTSKMIASDKKIHMVMTGE
ncbi:U3 small nucleolar RNA-associated protein 25 homolog [Microplitis mediator]|uniref:U3 small nucleolar RNA-associated protein 25 homolog n=1 Tax=Microplitis mediator TaxID=375433 RepID=UPI0025529E61|nr:U3 small nucleolar RNA-associated protein 25 homolog [Microplitis mediator]